MRSPWLFRQGLRIAELATFIRRMGLPFRRVHGPRGGDQVRLTATDRQEFHDRFISVRSLGVKPCPCRTGR